MTATIDLYTTASSTATASPVVEVHQELWLFWPVASASSSTVADQAWFWTAEWQQGEREVEEHIAAGRTTYFASVEEFLAALDRETG
jgi:hypothetical protein